MLQGRARRACKAPPPYRPRMIQWAERAGGFRAEPPDMCPGPRKHGSVWLGGRMLMLSRSAREAASANHPSESASRSESASHEAAQSVTSVAGGPLAQRHCTRAGCPCNKAATRLQQGCNKAASRLQQGARLAQSRGASRQAPVVNRARRPHVPFQQGGPLQQGEPGPMLFNRARCRASSTCPVPAPTCNHQGIVSPICRASPKAPAAIIDSEGKGNVPARHAT
jgi:hypothetical protein